MVTKIEEKVKAMKSEIKENVQGTNSDGRNSQPHRRVHWRDPQGLRTYTNLPTRESAPKGPNLLVSSGGSE